MSWIVGKVSAAGNSDCVSKPGDAFNPECPPNISDILGGPIAQTIQQGLFGLGPILFVVAVVYAGFTRLTAADNGQKVKQSNFTIMWGAIGYAVVLLSFLIIRLAASLLGYDKVGTTVGVDL